MSCSREVKALKHIETASKTKINTHTHTQRFTTLFTMNDHEFFQSVSPPVKERAIATLINIDKLFREMSLEMEK